MQPNTDHLPSDLLVYIGLWLCVLFLQTFASMAHAHEVRPAYLGITETAPHRYEVLWKQPAMDGVAVQLVPHLTNGWLDINPAEIQTAPGFVIKRWHALGPSTLEGETVSVEGLEHTITDVLISVTLADGRQIRDILKPDASTLTLHFESMRAVKASGYMQLGIEHILSGFDHLMFVLGLLLLVNGCWRLVKTITAFTVAHSITLAVAALALVRVQPTIIEALVALSIVFLAVEVVHVYQGRHGLTVRYPWLTSFTFGLLHGFAFAGALADIGLARNDIPLSLLLFNIGVEIGQLLFVAVALVVIGLIRRLPKQLPPWARWLPPYAIGSFASLWVIQRLAVVFAFR